jgi:hypothetical protein
MRNALTCAIVVAFLGLMGPATTAGASTLSVIGSSAKVCQLTGQTDWITGQPTNAQTNAKYGLHGVDLGFPVESESGQLLLLFGDVDPSGHAMNAPPSLPPDDATGYTTRTAAPDSSTCLDMKVFSPGPQQLTHPTVTPVIQQGSFNVPTGGIDVLGQLFEFFWTNHCVFPNDFPPNSGAPLALPAASNHCFEIPVNNSLGVSVMAAASPWSPTSFTMAATPMANGFVYVTAAQPAPRRFPIPRGHGRMAPPPPIPVFGVARYRASIPYLALAPRKSFGDVTTWSYYGGSGPSGPVWLTYQQWQAGQQNGHWAPPQGAELYSNSLNPGSPTGDERCVGEHSVTWNAELGVWLMLYTCGGLQVEARTAPEPWGPWSGPTMLLSAIQNPGLYCTLFWNPAGCPGLMSAGAQGLPVQLQFGYFYAPYVMTRFNQAATPQAPAPAKAASIYWLLSTWDPYQVTVMHSTLQLTP